MKRAIVQNPNSVLRDIAKEVDQKEFNTKTLDDLLKDMSDTLVHEGDGVALAAPQIGVSKRIFVIAGKIFDESWKDGQPLVNKPKDIYCINPEIIKISKDSKLMHEGCLSVRPIYGDIRRASRAVIRYQNEKGETCELSGTGLLAEIFQHEIDHLDGILFIDKAKNLKDGEITVPKKHKK